MPNPWDAEKIVSIEIATWLIESAFPELKPVQVQPFGAGCDNTVFLVNGDLIFRFPRRQIAVPLLDTEVRVLPTLAPMLPLPIPVPRWRGSASERYPWPFMGYQRLRGRNALHAKLDDDARQRLARPLGEWLATLHAIPPADVTEWKLDGDQFDRLEVERHSEKMVSSLAELVEKGVLDDAKLCLDLVGRVRVPSVGKTTLVHGDLHAENLLAEGDELTGIIDWGEVHCGNPSLDLSIAWTFFRSAGREAILAAYGPVDDATLSLAQFHALRFAIGEEAYGRDRDDALHVAEARRTLVAMF